VNGPVPLSWSIRLAAGADLHAADSRIVLPLAQLSAAGTTGSITLNDPHPQPYNASVPTASTFQLPGWSVIRTGTGDLDVLAGGSINELSTYAIYTAGASVQASAPYELPRGASTVQVLQNSTANTQTARITTTTGRTEFVSASTVLTDPSGNKFTLAQSVTVRIANGVSQMFSSSNAPLSEVRLIALSVAAATSDGSQTPLTFASNIFKLNLAASVASPAVVGTVSTILGTNGQTINNGSKFESLVSNYQGWYPAGGGNVLISAGANIAGNLAVPSAAGVTPMDGIGNWLWRQGGTASGQSTAWWVNFGTLVLPLDQAGNLLTAGNATAPIPTLSGFTGIGTLGGGNVTILAGGDIGASRANSQGLDVAVGSTGRVAPGATDGSGITETGGGIMTIRAGGALNGGGTSATNTQLNGTLTNTRGAIDVRVGSIGQIPLTYGQQSTADPRAANQLTASLAVPQGGPTVVPGDSTVSLRARGDLVLGGVGDPGRLPEQNLTSFTASPGAAPTASGLTWFSLWQPTTAIHLESAGGNLVASSLSYVQQNGNTYGQANALATDNRFLYPPILTAAAYGGSIYAGAANRAGSGLPSSIELAPSPDGQLELLAARSIFGDAIPGGAPQSFDISGAPLNALATPFNPAFMARGVTSLPPNLPANTLSLFANGADNASGTLHVGDTSPALILAGGDIVGLRYGEILTITDPKISPSIWYVSGKPVRIVAGGDIVDQPVAQPNPLSGGSYKSSSDLILNNNPTDVSVIQAGGKIIFANATIAGPGQLYVQAGTDVYQADQASLESLGPLNGGGPSRSGGAGITVLAGAGQTGPDWSGFANTYLAPAAGYNGQLVSFLQSNDPGLSATSANAVSLFDALPLDQRRSFLLSIYFTELRDSGREFTDTTSPRFKSYARGRSAIAALFPSGTAGTGDITLFGNAGIHTDFGGTITLLSPGGATTLGVATGPLPTSSAGVITQGTGDIDIYSQNSVLLGQSRVFTTFGGSIMIWSARGDINAGRGAKTTQAPSGSLVRYDALGRVTLSPDIPRSGAGIATLAPIPGTKSGDVDLVAPLGTIDAGEAGIRVSGNVNLAALTVLNAANISTGGKSTGLPTVVAPNTGALSAASATAAAAQSAEQAKSSATAPATQETPSTIAIDFLGWGDQ
jgi:hypothetical protein